MLAAHVERGAKNHYNRIAGAVFEGVFLKFLLFFFLAYLFSFYLFFSLFFQLCSSSIFDENFGIGIILDTSSAGYHFSYFFS